MRPRLFLGLSPQNTSCPHAVEGIMVSRNACLWVLGDTRVASALEKASVVEYFCWVSG